MITFQVSNVEEAKARKVQLDRDRVLRGLLSQPVEAMYRSGARLVECDDGNQFARAVYAAFCEHRPLALSPDAVWFCIAGGFANHMSLHAEALRKRFVSHEGRLKLTVERRDFVLGSDNPWHEVFGAFSDQIAAHVGKARDLIVCDFSTTGPLERAASEVLLMDSYQAYFEYECISLCGIPRIHLRGSVEDWRSVRTRTRALSEYGLESWVDVLDPVLAHFEQAAEGDVDLGFWRSFYRHESVSGGDAMTGWILTLFPYLLQGDGALTWNRYMQEWSQAVTDHDQGVQRFFRHGPTMGELPPSLASAPVRFVDMRRQPPEEHDLRFVSGLFGVVEDAEDGTLAPEFGWAVVHGTGTGKRFEWGKDEAMEEEQE